MENLFSLPVEMCKLIKPLVTVDQLYFNHFISFFIQRQKKKKTPTKTARIDSYNEIDEEANDVNSDMDPKSSAHNFASMSMRMKSIFWCM